MARTYNVVDADGHILEPLDLWDHYMDPEFRDRAPRIVKGENGRERLIIAEHTVGAGERGIGTIGAVGARQGVVAADTMEYKDGKPGGFWRCPAFHKQRYGLRLHRHPQRRFLNDRADGH